MTRFTYGNVAMAFCRFCSKFEATGFLEERDGTLSQLHPVLLPKKWALRHAAGGYWVETIVKGKGLPLEPFKAGKLNARQMVVALELAIAVH